MAPNTYSPCSLSSGDAESHHGTPGTKLTDFSPEDFRGDSKIVSNDKTKPNHPPAFTLQGVPLKFSPDGKSPNLTSSGAQDPFTATTNTRKAGGNAAAGIKLSPTAASFKPAQSGFSLAATLKSEPIQGRIPLSSVGKHQKASQVACNVLGVSYLNATSVPDLGPSHLKLTQNILSIPGGASQAPIGPPVTGNLTTLSTSATSSPTDPISECSSSSRYLKIRVSRDTTQDLLNAIFIVGISLSDMISLLKSRRICPHLLRNWLSFLT